MFRVLFLALLAVCSVHAAAQCCWSRWGDSKTCGNYPSGGKGGLCNTDPIKKCSSTADCPTTPVPAPSPSPVCQKAADAECNRDCWPSIRSRPCDGSMVARSNLQRDYKGWRCYSPSTLEDHETKYKGGDCYCSRDAQALCWLSQRIARRAAAITANIPLFCAAVWTMVHRGERCRR